MSSFSPTSAVRNSSRQWMEGGTTTVSINITALEKFADEITQSILSNKSLEVTEWDADGWHYTGTNYQKKENGKKIDDVDDVYYELMRMERVALYILTLDAINFCFWPLSDDTQEDDDGRRTKNGLEYEHLAIALRKVAEADDGMNLEVDRKDEDDSTSTIIHAAATYALSPTNLSNLTPAKLQAMLKPHFPPNDDNLLVQYELPNIEVRCKLLNELGKGLLDHHNGSALHMIAKANKSADTLVGVILDTFPGFRDFVDTSEWGKTTTTPCCDWEVAKSLPPTVIHFYKRAQIAVADIWAALGRQCSSDTPASLQICHFSDMNLVTTFPDYRVPQILRHVDVLQYSIDLAKQVDDQVELEKAGIDEVSIRAATVVAVEEIVTRVKDCILSSTTSEASKKSHDDLQNLAVGDVSCTTIDWYLWQQGEKLDRANLLSPHHRIRTTFY